MSTAGGLAEDDRVLSARLVGVDIARALALLGMMLTHIMPTVLDADGSGDLDGAVYIPAYQQIAIGRSSALFAVLAGLSLSLAFGAWRGAGAARQRDVDRGSFVALAVRALLIVAVGLTLGELDSSIAIILAYYGVFFVVAAPFLMVATRWLLILALAWAVLGPQLSHVLRKEVEPTSYDVPSWGYLVEAPGAMFREILLTGYYPALTFLPYLLVGLLVARLDLRSALAWLRLLVVGAVLVVASYAASSVLTAGAERREVLADSFSGAGWLGALEPTLIHGLFGVTPTDAANWLLVVAPHSGTTFDLAATIGSSLVVLAACLALGAVAPWLRIVFGVGAMPLTAYALHVYLTSEGVWDTPVWATFVGQGALLGLLGAVWAALGLRGPLEGLVSVVSKAAGALARPAPLGSVASEYESRL